MIDTTGTFMEPSFEAYFYRQIELWGKERQKSLQDKKVAIIGCGGLGCSLGVSLGSSGIGEFHLIDFDKVSAHNIHRQIAFKEGDEGRFKAHLLAEIMEDRCSYTKVHPHCKNFEDFVEQESENIKLDLIIDATDNLEVRKKIDSFAKERNIPWIYGSVEEFHGHVCFFEKSGFDAFKISDTKPKGIAAPIVMFIASLQANLALRYLVGLPIKKDILYYARFDEEGDLILDKFKMPES